MLRKSAKKKEAQRLTLDKIGSSHRIDLHLRANYTQFTAKEAFRELTQNWRDGIMEQIDINAGELAKCIKREYTKNGSSVTITYRASKPNGHRRECLGFIRYKGDNGVGTVEFTNFNATLQPWHLDMGGTGKRGNARMVGTHGEGLNIAVLAMMRPQANHDIRCTSGGYEWTFKFNKTGTLCVDLWRYSQSDVLKQMLEQDRSAGNRTLADPDKDISVLVGSKTQYENEEGITVNRKGVTEEDFVSWLDTTLFLQSIPSVRMIYTDAGCLVIPASKEPPAEGEDSESDDDPEDTGRMFHKGFLLAPPCENSTSMSGKPFKFTYDSHKGEVNRERGGMADAITEGRATTEIWELVLRTRPEMIEYLVNMLMDRKTQWADVHEWYRHSTEDLAVAVKAHLLQEHPNTWFVSDKEAADPATLQTVTGWDMEALALPPDLYRAGKKMKVIRGVAEEGARRFNNSKIMRVAELQNTHFAREVHRIVKHLIMHCNWTSKWNVLIVEGGGARQSLLIGGRRPRVFKVHEKWFNAELISEDLGLKWRTDGDGIFTVTKALFSEMLDGLRSDEVVAYRPSMRGKPRDWRVRNEKARWEQHIRVVTSAAPVIIEPYTPAVAHVVVKWQVPIEWRRDPEDPGSVEIEVQVHSVESCDMIRWYGTEKSDIDNGPATCVGHGCWCFKSNGRVEQAEIPIPNSTQKYFAIILNKRDRRFIPMVSENISAPHNGPPEFPEEQVPEPPNYVQGRTLESLTLREPHTWYEAKGHFPSDVVIGIARVKREYEDEELPLDVPIKTEGFNPRNTTKRKPEDVINRRRPKLARLPDLGPGTRRPLFGSTGTSATPF